AGGGYAAGCGRWFARRPAGGKGAGACRRRCHRRARGGRAEGLMTAVAFPSEDALVAAITSQLLSKAELAAAVRYWRVDETCWVRPLDALADATVARLAGVGAKVSKKRAPRHAQAGSSWLEAAAAR